MNDDSVLGALTNQIGDLGKQIGLSTIQAPADVVKTASVQVGIVHEESKEGKSEGGESVKSEAQKAAEAELGSQKAEEFKNLMYAPSSFDHESSDPNLIARLAQQGNAKTPEEEAKIAALQNQLKSQLHQDVYYDPTFNRRPPEEEHVREKDEREEEQQKMAELEFQEEKKKDEDISVTMARNKTEQFRGASG